MPNRVTVAGLGGYLLRGLPPTGGELRLRLDFGGYVTEVVTNSQALVEKLRDYFQEFLLTGEGGVVPDTVIHALETPPRDPQTLGLRLGPRPRDPGKTSVKEEFQDLEDGRVVRKRLTDMLFVFGRGLHLVVGPCLENDNQVVNFINNRFIQWTLDRGALLCHAAGVAMPGPDGLSGLALAGFAGMGKSSLALAIMSRGALFVSNDRLMLGKHGNDVIMYGLAKMPRINPGTVLHNRDLSGVIPEEQRTLFAAMPVDALWSLEHKYDACIQTCYGPGRFALTARLNGLVLLHWSRPGSGERKPVSVRRVDLEARPDLMPAFIKSVGVFYLQDTDAPVRDFSPQAYLELLRGRSVYEITGTADIEAAATACLDLF
jgi:HprK-related kinase B